MKHLLFALILAPLAASANPGALEINQDCVAVGCFAGDAAGYPVTITAPGSYILTSDLAPPGSTSVNAIEIAASPVDVDLNGHTMDGGGTCTGNPVTSCTGSLGARAFQVYLTGGAPAVSHIHHGTIRGFSSTGISIFYAEDGTVLDHLTLTQNAYGALIAGNTASSVTRILNSEIVRNLSEGAGVANGPSVLHVENSTVAGNGTYGGLSLGPGSTAVGNRISHNGGSGLSCNGACALGQNTFVGNNGSSAEYSVTTLINMGGNVCLDYSGGTCP